ncbi:hypothetical protein ACNUDN_22395 [Mycobacterium sp. smrl_JER01]|uniref:hypothetical protein n=1 Tax=Mycobacterium sp. smrl_JER01 TaxID=3402633 RepID=UPI003ACB13B5
MNDVVGIKVAQLAIDFGDERVPARVDIDVATPSRRNAGEDFSQGLRVNAGIVWNVGPHVVGWRH